VEQNQKNSSVVMLTLHKPTNGASLGSQTIAQLLICSEGTAISSAESENTCSPCAKGHYNNGSQPNCLPCPLQTFAALEMSDSCNACPSHSMTTTEGTVYITSLVLPYTHYALTMHSLYTHFTLDDHH
jgi:hypothetical protein